MSRKSKRRKNTRLKLVGLMVLLSLASFVLYKMKPAIVNLGKNYTHSSQETPSLFFHKLDSLRLYGWEVVHNPLPGLDSISYSIVIPASLPLVRANLIIQKKATACGFSVFSAVENRKKGLLEIRLSKEPSPVVGITVRKKLSQPLSSNIKKIALVAYEISDPWPKQEKMISSCPAVMTVAGSSRVLNLSWEIFTYLPLEPKGYPQKDPGPNTLLVDDRPAALRTKLSRIVSQNPRAAGLCIHYGTRAVEDATVMGAVANFCAEKNLPLLEPVPTAASLAFSSCRQAQVIYMKPDVYIARGASFHEAREKLSKAIGMSEKQDRILVLLPATENALKAAREIFPPGRRPSFQLVPLSKLYQP